MIVIVPDFVEKTINAKLDIAIKEFPYAEKDRKYLYGRLLEYFNENGIIPDFTLSKMEY